VVVCCVTVQHVYRCNLIYGMVYVRVLLLFVLVLYTVSVVVMVSLPFVLCMMYLLRVVYVLTLLFVVLCIHVVYVVTVHVTAMLRVGDIGVDVVDCVYG